MVVHLLGHSRRLLSLQRALSEADMVVCLDAGVCCELADAYYEAQSVAQLGLARPNLMSMSDVAQHCAGADKVISWY